jgi:L-ascorbate metabolism protein UlaG (beta-lactamase superfamily)
MLPFPQFQEATLMPRVFFAATATGTAVVAALALMVSATPAADAPAPGTLNIRWHGQSFFEIVTPAKTDIITDPHALDAYGKKSVKPELVLMSHLHSDHTRLDNVDSLKDPKMKDKVKLINALKKGEEGGRVDWNLVDEKFKDVHIQSVGTYHDTKNGLERGKNGIWIIDVDGLRIVHLGDLGHQLSAAQLKKLGTVDVLMIPVGGVYTLNGIEAQKVVDQIKPRRWVLPMHYGTVVYDELLDLKYFTDEQEEGTEIKKFGKDEWLKIDPKSPLPKKYSVGVLHW